MRSAIVFLLVMATNAVAATLAATGSWTKTISAANLTGGAGTNLVSTHESANGVISLDVSNTPSTVLFYKVYARYTGPTWPSGVTLAVKRTADGISLLPLSVILGSTDYITLGSTDTEIFTGLLDRSGITLQVRVSGLSVAVTPAVYQANIVFTITP
jgi:hypothetical protein